MQSRLLVVFMALILASCGSEESVSEVDSGPVALINSLADKALSLVGKDRGAVESTIIAHALPPGKSAFDLSGWEQKEQVFEKLLESTLGSDLIFLRYKIAYQFAGKSQGKGAYVANVKFIPVRLKEDPFWTLNVSSLSEQPLNAGSEANPIAKLRFSITFTASGIGTRGATDEFSIDGASGELQSELNEMD